MNTKHNGVHSWLLEYIDACKRGEILAGRELLQEFDILLRDFADPSVKVDFTEAHKRVGFIQDRCRHSEAPFAGKPFILMLWQKALIEAVYIFQVFDDEMGYWVRKYQDVLMLVGRKNGKTPMVSAVCLAEWFCGRTGTKILCSSNDYEQADLMVQAIDAMREQSPALAKATRKNIKGMFFGNPKKPRHTGKFSYRNKGSIRRISSKTGAKEGRNIAAAACDEIHELKDNSSIMPIRQALSTQPEPLYIELTTEGFTADGYLDQRLNEARQALDGKLERPRWLIWLYTQDDPNEIWRDERAWQKSNPSLGTVKRWSFLRQMIEEAKTNKATRAFVLAKDFNIKQSTATAFLSREEILACDGTFNIENLRGCVALGGVDLSETTDLTSARALIMRPGSNAKLTLSMYFIPASKHEQNKDNKDYLQWARDRLVTVCPGNDIDFSMVTDWFIMLQKQYGIKFFKVGYDGWHAKEWAKQMDDHIGGDMQRVPMERRVLSDPMKLMEADIKSRLVNYNRNPVDVWCLENLGFNIDKLGAVMPVKKDGKPINRIDGAVSLIICYALLKEHRTEYLSVIR